MNQLTLEKFEEAYERVQEVVLPTNLIKSDFFSDITGNKVYLKPENLQPHRRLQDPGRLL